MTDFTVAGRRVAGAWWRSFPLLLLTAGLWSLVAIAFIWWPWLQIPLLIFGLAPMVGGSTAVCAQAVRGAPIRVTALFDGFKAIDRWTGVIVMILLHIVLSLLPLCVGIAIANLSVRDARPFVMGAGALVSLPLLAGFAVRLAFVPVVALDAPSKDPMADVFQRAGVRATEVRWAVAAVWISAAAATAVLVRVHPLLSIVVGLCALMAIVALHDQGERRAGDG